MRGGKKWTKEEEEFLRDNYSLKTLAEIAENLGRTKNSVMKKMAKLSLQTKIQSDVSSKSSKGKKHSDFEWTESKLRILSKYYAVSSNSTLAEHLECSVTEIKKKADKLGLKKPEKSWTPEQDSYLKNNYADTDWDEMIGSLDKTRSEIQNRASNLGLKREKNKIDREYVSNYYNGYNLHELAAELGTTSMGLYHIIKDNKLHMSITPDIKEKRLEVIKIMNEGRTKTCSNCGILSNDPIIDFPLQYQNPDGLRSMCKTCFRSHSQMTKALRQINEEVKKEKEWKKSINNQEYQCKGCEGIFKGGDMSIVPARFYVRSWCKKCYNKQQKENSIERMMRKAKGVKE